MNAMVSKIYLTNVFADGPFTGEKCAVVIVSAPGWEFLSRLTVELGVAVTVCVLPRGDDFMLRFFTAEGETARADQAALAAATVLYEAGLHPPKEAVRLFSRGAKYDFYPDKFSGRATWALNPPPALRVEASRAAPLLESLKLSRSEVMAVESSAGRLLVYCRSPESLDKFNPANNTAGEDPLRPRLTPADLNGALELAVSAPSAAAGEKGYELIVFRPESPENVARPGRGESDEHLAGATRRQGRSDSQPASVGLRIQSPPHLSDLDLYGPISFFWSRNLAFLQLKAHRRLMRKNLLNCAILPGEEKVLISGQVASILKADLLPSALSVAEQSF